MRRRTPEADLQIAVIYLLRLSLGGNAICFHVPNGGKRSLTEAKRFKAMGVLSGIPDIAILDGGKIFWLELKSKRGTVTEVQRECHKALCRAGSTVAIIKSVDEVLPQLQRWGIAIRDGVHLSSARKMEPAA